MDTILWEPGHKTFLDTLPFSLRIPIIVIAALPQKINKLQNKVGCLAPDTLLFKLRCCADNSHVEYRFYLRPNTYCPLMLISQEHSNGQTGNAA